jgi:hypothetical protein
MRTLLRVGAWIAAVLCFLGFLCFSVEGRSLVVPGPNGSTRKPVHLRYRVGLSASPWLTGEQNAPLPGGGLRSYTNVHPLSWSTTLLLLGVLALWTIRRLKPKETRVAEPSNE